jgi:hypothetical protein
LPTGNELNDFLSGLPKNLLGPIYVYLSANQTETVEFEGFTTNRIKVAGNTFRSIPDLLIRDTYEVQLE